VARRATARKTLKPKKRPVAAKPARAPAPAPTERLLSLIATLLDARKPLSLKDLREKLPPGFYDGSDEAAERKFERDKDVLLELGIPVRYKPADDEDDVGGYLVDRERLFLPDLDLSPDESATLFFAGSALLEHRELPYRDDLERALEKIRLRGEVPASQGAADRVLFHYPSLDGGAAIAKTLAAIHDALARRKTLTLVYRSGGDLDGVKRKVDPYGLFCRRGRWLLVGQSHERASLRVFAVQKIEQVAVNAAKPRLPDFEVPKTFTLRDQVAVAPWRYQRHAPVTVEIDVEAAYGWLAEQELETPGVPTIERAMRFRVQTTNQDALVEWLLGMGTKARVVSPEPLRKAVRDRIDAVLGMYAR
jgi:proteasome accessory factor B